MLLAAHLVPHVDRTTSIARLKREAVVKTAEQDISPPVATTRARRGTRVRCVLRGRLAMGRVKVRSAFPGHLVQVALVAARHAVETRCLVVRQLLAAINVPPGHTRPVAHLKHASRAHSAPRALRVRVEVCTSPVRQEPSVAQAVAYAQPVGLMICTVVLGQVSAGSVLWDRTHMVDLRRNDPPVQSVLVAGHV